MGGGSEAAEVSAREEPMGTTSNDAASTADASNTSRRFRAALERIDGLPPMGIDPFDARFESGSTET
jgi:hypothetical protein